MNLLETAQSRELLALWAGLDVVGLPLAADDILRECGRLPLALATVGSMLRSAAPVEWADTASLLRNANLTSIDVSVNALEPKLRQYGSLAVLLDGLKSHPPLRFSSAVEAGVKSR